MGVKVTKPSRRTKRTFVGSEATAGMGTSVQEVQLLAGPANSVNFPTPAGVNKVSIINEGPGPVDVNFNSDTAKISLDLNDRLEKVGVTEGDIINVSKEAGPLITVKLLLEG